jgi:hypothetical protein
VILSARLLPVDEAAGRVLQRAPPQEGFAMRARFAGSFFVLMACAGLAQAAPAPFAKPPRPEQGMKLVLRLDRSEYRPGESIRAEWSLVNASRRTLLLRNLEPFYLDVYYEWRRPGEEWQCFAGGARCGTGLRVRTIPFATRQAVQGQATMPLVNPRLRNSDLLPGKGRLAVRVVFSVRISADEGKSFVPVELASDEVVVEIVQPKGVDAKAAKADK